MMEAELEELRNFVSSRQDLQFVSNNTKVKSLVTQHEMPARLTVIKEHTGTPCYRRKRDAMDFDFSSYEPFIVKHKSDPLKLYCHLTGHVLNRDAKEVTNEINGRRYKRLLKVFLEAEDAKKEKLEKLKEKKLARKKRRESELADAESTTDCVIDEKKSLPKKKKAKISIDSEALLSLKSPDPLEPKPAKQTSKDLNKKQKQKKGSGQQDKVALSEARAETKQRAKGAKKTNLGVSSIKKKGRREVERNLKSVEK
eukprot:Selendium_serpulae@DN4195_c0_g1_i1.p1